MAKRFLLATVGIVVLSGVATYLLVRDEIGNVVSAFAQNKPVKVRWPSSRTICT